MLSFFIPSENGILFADDSSAKAHAYCLYCFSYSDHHLVPQCKIFMDFLKRLRCFSKTRTEERFSLFLENGSQLLEGLVASSGGRYGVPYRNFTAKELIRATTNFKDFDMWDGTGFFYRGSFQERQILVKSCSWEGWQSFCINDMVISLQMSHHKNVFKLLGCCLEFKTLALVYECDAANTQLLSDILYNKECGQLTKDVDSPLSWRVRLKLAMDIGNALVYLHSAFATPIIHRCLCARNIVISSDGVAKLLDFSLCIALPPGESQVEDRVVGVTGVLEPEYGKSGIITEKTDVYIFGMLLLELLTREKTLDRGRELVFLPDHVEDHFVNNEIDKILDPILLPGKAENEQEYEQQMRAFVELALRCTRPEGKDRPDMLTVAKELVQIKKSLHFSSA